ncbi:MAG: hypothetical protein A4E37_02091 [Methanoregulaceae archaeon PtaB.Bin056]|jgi:hypothetical protein|nr:MAG: hypothetical protein A4E37_02091 [Methanoregulaceae archaeon PtaB.Bin056]
MTGEKRGFAAVIAVLFVIVILPVGWILIAFPAEPHYPVPGEPVDNAVNASGVMLAHVNDITWQIPGAMGGRSYLLEDEEGHTLVVQTQVFETAESRDAAVVTYSAHTVGKGRPIGRIMVIGHQVVYIGPDPGGIFQRIAPLLREMRIAG